MDLTALALGITALIDAGGTDEAGYPEQVPQFHFNEGTANHNVVMIVVPEQATGTDGRPIGENDPVSPYQRLMKLYAMRGWDATGKPKPKTAPELGFYLPTTNTPPANGGGNGLAKVETQEPGTWTFDAMDVAGQFDMFSTLYQLITARVKDGTDTPDVIHYTPSEGPSVYVVVSVAAAV